MKNNVLRLRVWAGLLIAGTLFSGGLRADDSAAAISAGGLRLVHAAGIAMRREVLEIGPAQVRVAYDFENQTDQPITTLVAFPLPLQSADDLTNPEAHPFDPTTFHLRVDGKTVPFQMRVRAMLRGKDVTPQLRALGIDPASYGGLVAANRSESSREYAYERPAPQIARLARPLRLRLLQQGMVTSHLVPTWMAEEAYVWKQEFPPHRLVHIEHEYVPAFGYSYVEAEDFEALRRPPGKEDFLLGPALRSACIDSGLRRRLEAGIPANDLGRAEWVDFILMTAKNWKGPIGSFELILDKVWPDAASNGDGARFVSVCWPGRFNHDGPDRLVSRVHDFVPQRDLHVVFFSLPAPKARAGQGAHR